MDKISENIESFFSISKDLKRDVKREMEILFGKYLQSEYAFLIPTEYNINLSSSYKYAFPDQEVYIPSIDLKKKRQRPTLMSIIRKVSELQVSPAVKTKILINNLKDEIIIVDKNECYDEYLDTIKLTNKLLDTKTNAPKQMSFCQAEENKFDRVGSLLLLDKDTADIRIRHMQIFNINTKSPLLIMYVYKPFNNKDFLNWNRSQINGFISNYKDQIDSIIKNNILPAKDLMITFDNPTAMINDHIKLITVDRLFYNAFNLSTMDTKEDETIKFKIAVGNINFKDLFNIIINKKAKAITP